MPQVELYINSQLCDLKGDESIEVDYSIFDISKIGSRGGARSYEFSLPKTNINKGVLENPEMVNNLSEVPYTRMPALVLVDGVDVLIRFCEVSSAGQSYKIRLYGGNSDLFALLSDRKLFDLNLSRFDHVWNLTEVNASRLNTEGIIYAIIDFHEDSPNADINNDNTTINIKRMLPSVFINTILNQIFAETPYTLVNEIEDETAELIMPIHFNAVQPGDYITGKYEGTLLMNSRLTVPDSSTLGQPLKTLYTFDAVTGNTGSYYNFPYYVPGTTWRALKIVDRVQFKMTISIDITFQTPVNSSTIFLNYYDSNGNLLQGNVNIPTSNNYTAGTHTITFDFYPLNLQPVQRERYITIDFVNLGGFIGSPSDFYIESSSSVVISDVTYLGQILFYNNFLPTAAIMPDMTQTDFVKNYMLMFGLIPVIDDLRKTVTLRKFQSILSRLSSAYDWSDKIDYTDEPEVSFMLNDYAQNNLFKYQQDGDEPIPVDANGTIQVNNKNMELEKTIVELDFAATNSFKRLIELLVPQIGVYKDQVWANEKLPRVLQLNKLTSFDIGTMTYTDEISSVIVGDNIPMCYFIAPSQTFNLGFGNNLLATYYQLILVIISRLKVVRVPLRLSASDVSQLDFSTPAFIRLFESYFYISSIKAFSYTESKSTLVELVKLNING